LAFRDSTFDIVLITAVLQYCVDPPRVVLELSRVLKPNGLLYVDAPLVQPYCPDTPDLFRFTKHGLIKLFQNEFIIEECDTSIPAGSALAFYIQALVATTSLGNRYINYVFVFFISLLIFPLSIMNFNKNHHVAGALYLVGRNSKNIDRKHRDITI
jgi:SAM-dependent methyltransferase